MAEYEISVLDNAKDSFVTGVQMYLDRENAMGWKYALLLIGQAIELFLKGRLAQIDESAVFVDPKKTNAGARTIGYDQAISRLEGRGIPISAANRETVSFIRGVRNDVEHFQIRIEQGEVDRYVTAALRFLDDFLYDEFGFDVIDLFESQALFQEFKERTKTVDEQIAEAEKRAADQLPSRPKDRYYWQLAICPECYAEAVPVNERIGPAKCQRCGTEWNRVEECVRCASAALVHDDDVYPYYCEICS